MRPGAGAEIILLINTVFTAVSYEDAGIKKTSIETYFLWYLLSVAEPAPASIKKSLSTINKFF